MTARGLGLAEAIGAYLLRGSGWALGGRMLAVLCAFAINVLLSRLLSPDDYGSYFLALSIVTVASTIGVLGLDRTAVRLVAERGSTVTSGGIRPLVTIIFRMALAGAGMATALFLLLRRTLLIDFLDNSSLFAHSTAIALWILVAVLQIVGAEIFRGLKNIRLATLFGGLHTGGVLNPLLFLSGLVLLALAHRSSLAATLQLAVLASGVIVLLAPWALRRWLRLIDEQPGATDTSPPSAGRILTIALPLLIAALLTTLRTSGDLLVVGAFSASEEVALYGVAKRVVGLLLAPLMIVNAVLPPVVAALWTQGKNRSLEETVRVVATISSAIGVPIFLLLLVFGQPLLGLVFGDFYQASLPALRLLLLGQALNILAGPNAVVLAMTGNQKLLMIGMAISAAWVLLLASFMAPAHGATGVAFAASTGLLLQNCALLGFARWRVGFWTLVLFSPQRLRNGLGLLRSTHG
jgi:O-antigen/teichoic acid export membrane protein